MPDVPALDRGAEITLVGEMNFHDVTGQSIKVDVTSDKGRFSGTLVVQQHDLLEPRLISPTNFACMRSELGFLNEAKAVITHSSVGANGMAAVAVAVQRTVNLYTVAESEGALSLAGCYAGPSGAQVRTLVSVSNGDGGLSVTVNCDQPTFGSLLLAVLKTQLK
jgi:hypothetical protein